MSKFNPMASRMLVKVREEKAKKTETGIIVPEEAGKKGSSVMMADVLEVGPDVTRTKIGQVVVFSPFGFDEIHLDGEKLLVVDESLILGSYEE